MLKYSEHHQWVEYEDGLATIGITSYALDQLGELNFVELPPKGAAFTQDDVLCIVESAKTATDILTPIGGTVAELNTLLENNIQLINETPEGEGWICKLNEVDEKELDALMNDDEYELYVERQAEGEE